MFERRLRALVVVVGMAAAIIGLMIAPAGASSRVRAHQAPVVRPHFRFVGGAVLLWTGARYALAAPEALPGPPLYSPATLIDDQSGQVKTIAQAGCYPVLGQPSTLEPPDLPWVPFNCGWPGQPVPELYSPATGQWQAVSSSPGAVQSCDSSNCTDDFLAAAGRYWLEYNHSSCDSGNQHCSYSNVFQNIATGELRQDPSAATTMVDLNAPDLTRTVCAPLRVPTTFEPYGGPPAGSLTFYGSFAVSIGGKNGSEVYLERCGARLHRLLTTAPLGGLAVVGANTHEVVWMAHAGRILNALTLPGLRRFTIRLPNRLVASTCSQADYTTCVAQIALTNQRLYLLTAGPSPAHLWAAPNPRPAKRRRSARRAGGRAQQSSAHVDHAAWYVGTTSAGTRIDFRTSPSGERVRDFQFGSPALTCPDGSVPGATLSDGNFPLSGLRVSHHAFSGALQAEDFSPDNADSPAVRVSGSFINQQQVTGTLHEETRGDCGFTPFTFTATRVRSLPGRPATASGYSGLTVRGSSVRFTVSRSGRRVLAFRFAAVDSDCLGRNTVFMLRMAHSYPAAGLHQNRDGVFFGVLSSRLSARGRPAGTRVRVSVLFLSRSEATGTVHVIAGAKILRFAHEKPCSSQETLPFRARLTK